jgi:hypothetical protein
LDDSVAVDGDDGLTLFDMASRDDFVTLDNDVDLGIICDRRSVDGRETDEEGREGSCDE